jgi:hypothetical protein
MLERIPSGAGWKKVQEIGAVNIDPEICCGSKKDPLWAVFIDKDR